MAAAALGGWAEHYHRIPRRHAAGVLRAARHGAPFAEEAAARRIAIAAQSCRVPLGAARLFSGARRNRRGELVHRSVISDNTLSDLEKQARQQKCGSHG